MKALYVTNDAIDSHFGGGPTCQPELEALREMFDDVAIINPPAMPTPFDQDAYALQAYLERFRGKVDLVHSYAGTFSFLARQLCEDGVHYTATCCAHDVSISKREHEKLGMKFEYPHLTEPGQFHQYTEHLRIADCVITPGSYPASVLDKQGVSRIQIVHHGFDGPDEIPPLPKKLVFGYLGSAGSDKGLIYLLQAWHKLNLDATLLLAGKCCESVKHLALNRVVCMGELKDTSEFYKNISVYVAPSTTEGFHLPVLEAQSYGRVALCSQNAGAADIAWYSFPACSVDAICSALQACQGVDLAKLGELAKERATKHSRAIQKANYQYVWRNVLKQSRPAFFGDYEQLKVNIGCFVNMFHYGWCNMDVLPLHEFARASGYKFVQHDMKETLPFRDNSVDLLFSHHSIEHIAYNDACAFFKELYRVMKVGAVGRLIVPSLPSLIKHYQERRMDHFYDNEGVNACPLQCGKFWNLLTAGHQMVYDIEGFKQMAEAVGFTATECAYRQGNKQILDETSENIPESIFMEITK